MRHGRFVRIAPVEFSSRTRVDLFGERSLSPAALLPTMPFVEYDEVEAVCSECGRPFRSQELLDAHREETHQVEDVSTLPTPPDGKVTCGKCHLPVANPAALQRHMRVAHRGRA